MLAVFVKYFVQTRLASTQQLSESRLISRPFNRKYSKRDDTLNYSLYIFSFLPFFLFVLQHSNILLWLLYCMGLKGKVFIFTLFLVLFPLLRTVFYLIFFHSISSLWFSLPASPTSSHRPSIWISPFQQLNKKQIKHQRNNNKIFSLSDILTYFYYFFENVIPFDHIHPNTSLHSHIHTLHYISNLIWKIKKGKET